METMYVFVNGKDRNKTVATGIKNPDVRNIAMQNQLTPSPTISPLFTKNNF